MKNSEKNDPTLENACIPVKVSSHLRSFVSTLMQGLRNLLVIVINFDKKANLKC